MLTTDKMDSPLNHVPCGRAPSYCRQYMVKNEINISGVEVFLYKDTERPYNDPPAMINTIQYNDHETICFYFRSSRLFRKIRMWCEDLDHLDPVLPSEYFLCDRIYWRIFLNCSTFFSHCCQTLFLSFFYFDFNLHSVLVDGFSYFSCVAW